MPDRYGNPRPGRDTPTNHPDPDPDPQPDYAAAAKRGTNRIRTQMGWPTRDETRDETNPPNQPPQTTPEKPPTGHTAPKNGPS